MTTTNDGFDNNFNGAMFPVDDGYLGIFKLNAVPEQLRVARDASGVLEVTSEDRTTVHGVARLAALPTQEGKPVAFTLYLTDGSVQRMVCFMHTRDTEQGEQAYFQLRPSKVTTTSAAKTLLEQREQQAREYESMRNARR